MGNQVAAPRDRGLVSQAAQYRPPAKKPSYSDVYGCCCRCWVATTRTEERVPLTSVSVQSNIIHTLAEITVNHTYQNQKPGPIESTFVFALGDNAVLSDMTITTKDKTIRGQIQEKEEAFGIYDDAISSGSGAYLLESIEKTNQYKLYIGNLAPQQEVLINFTFVIPLTPAHNGLIFTLPAALFPSHSSGVPTVDAKVTMSEELEAIEAQSSHELTVDLEKKTFRYAPGVETTEFNSDLIVLLKHKVQQKKKEKRVKKEKSEVPSSDAVTKQASSPSVESSPSLSAPAGSEVQVKPSLVVEWNPSAPNSFAAVLDFKPIINSAIPELASDYEFVALIDCSGAMYGTHLNEAISALKLLVHSLPQGSKFNLVSFGSNYSSLWQTSVVLEDSSLAKALWAIEHLSADMGDANLLRPLNSVYARRDYARQLCVFLITALDYSPDARSLTKLVSTNTAKNSRLFALGFGDVDQDLMASLAFAGRGEAHYPEQVVDEMLFSQLVAAFAPRVRDIKVDWKLAPNAKLFDQTPQRVPITASGSSALICSLLDLPVPEGWEHPDVIAKKKADEATAQAAKTVTAAAPDPEEGDTVAVASSSSKADVKGNDADDQPTNKKKETDGKEAEKAKTKTPAKKKRQASEAPKQPESVAPEPPKPVLPNGIVLPISAVVVTGIGPNDAPLNFEIPVSTAEIRAGSVLHSYSASILCKEYSNKVRTAHMSEAEIKNRVIEISTKYQVLSKFTSFVGVEERIGETATGALENVALPSQAKNLEQDVKSIGTLNVIKHRQPIYRPIRPQPYWSPPAAPVPVHKSAVSVVRTRYEKESFKPSFVAEKKKKKDYADFEAVENSIKSAKSAIGFDLRSTDDSDDEDDGLRVDDLFNKLPARYALAPPPPPARSSLAPPPPPARSSLAPPPPPAQSSSSSPPSFLVESSLGSPTMKLLKEESKREPEREIDRIVGGSGGRGSSFRNAASPRRVERAPDPEMNEEEKENVISNISQLTQVEVRAPVKRDQHHDFNLSAPEDWDYTHQDIANLKKLNTFQVPRGNSQTGAKPEPHNHGHSIPVPPAAPVDLNTILRTIVTSQRADGSWSSYNVSILLKVEAQAMESKNPLSESEKKGKNKVSSPAASPKVGKKRGNKEDAGSSDVEKSGKEGEPSSSSTTAAAQPQFSLQDVWATAVLLAFLQAKHESEKKFWMFLSMKAEVFLTAAIPDADMRSKIVAKASKYVTSLA